MSYEKIGRLVKALSTKTQKQELTWNETELDGVFETSFPNYSIRVLKGLKLDNYSGEPTTTYVLELINENGDILEEVDSDDLALVLNNAFIIMKGIYEAARRKVMGVEDALDSILDIIDPIDSDIPF